MSKFIYFLFYCSLSPQTKMNGFFQTAFYFSYMGLFCVGLGFLCGMFTHAHARICIRAGTFNAHKYTHTTTY